MEIISFDIVGKFAHFRKYYSNSTALSFSIPPRTTIMGLISSFMGYERDSYYKQLSSDNIRIGIFVKNPIRKKFHRLNHLKITSQSDFRGIKGHTQTPFEIIIPENIVTGEIIYTIYISNFENGGKEFDKIKNSLNKKGNGKYNLSFGVANFLCRIDNMICYSADQIIEKQVDNEYIVFNSAIVSNSITEIKFTKSDNFNYNLIEEEMIPSDYIDNYNREVKKMIRILYSISGAPIEAKFIGKYYELKNNEGKIFNIQFLE